MPALPGEARPHLHLHGRGLLVAEVPAGLGRRKMIHRAHCTCRDHQEDLGIFHSEADVRARAFPLHEARYGQVFGGEIIRSEGPAGTYYLHTRGRVAPAIRVTVTGS